MEIWQFIVLSIFVLFLLCLLLFPGFRARLKILMGGFLNLIVEDKAKTPEGARAIYNQAIEEAREEYAKVEDVYKRVSGKLDGLMKRREASKAELKETEAACERFVQANKMNEARVYSEKRAEIIEQIKTLDAAIDKMKSAVDDARQAYEIQEKRLSDLKRKSKNVIEGMMINQQLKESLDDINELRKTTPTSKLLEVVDDAYKESNEVAAGAKIAHENRLSTRVQKTEASAKQLAADDYLNQLKTKYNK